MTAAQLTLRAQPEMRDARLVLGFSGWMDGGEVSTGTIQTLVRKLNAKLLAQIDPEDFYILNFPGSMEVSALFRPHIKIEDGLLTSYEGPTNAFYHSQAHRLILFVGKEPNLKWAEYARCLFAVVERFDVSAIYFIGSVAGLVPHTREPRLYSTVSSEQLKEGLERLGVRFSNYEGPGSFSTYLLRLCAQRSLPMATLVAEIPAYVQGRNFRCIEAVTRRLAAILGINIQLEDLRRLGDQLEERLSEVIKEHPELAERIHELERDYDNEVFDTQMGDLKDWLEQQGIRLD